MVVCAVRKFGFFCIRIIVKHIGEMLLIKGLPFGVSVICLTHFWLSEMGFLEKNKRPVLLDKSSLFD